MLGGGENTKTVEERTCICGIRDLNDKSTNCSFLYAISENSLIFYILRKSIEPCWSHRIFTNHQILRVVEASSCNHLCSGKAIILHILSVCL